MLTAKTDSQPYLEASAAIRGAAHFCRGCGDPVILKSGRVRVPHFAHQPNASCAHGAKISTEHLMAQQLIAKALRERGVEVELEFPVPSLVGDRRADVMAWPPSDPTKRIAIEVQNSDLTVEVIDARTRSYQVETIAPLWLRLYDFGRWEDAERIESRNTIWIKRHYARSWEHWIHNQLGGQIWFIDAKTFLLWKGVFVPAYSYVESTSWYSPSGDEESAGGYWRDITQWVQLELEGPYRPETLRLKRSKVRGEDGQTRLCASFLPTGETNPFKPPALRIEFLTIGHFHKTPELQILAGEKWLSAKLASAPTRWREG